MIDKKFIYFDSPTCRMYSQEVIDYSQWVEKRLIPCFCDSETEYEKISDEYIQQREITFDPDTEGPFDATEDAHYVALESAQITAEINAYMLGMAIAGLWHLFEKQLMEFLEMELKTNGLENKKKFQYEDAKKKLKKFGIDMENLPCSSDINTLRLITNTIKHGEGHSYEELKKTKSDIIPSSVLNCEKQNFLSLLPIKKKEYFDENFNFSYGKCTMLRVHLCPRLHHFDKFKNALLLFWNADYWRQRGDKQYLLDSEKN